MKKQSKKTAASNLRQKVKELTPEERVRIEAYDQAEAKRPKPPKVKPFDPEDPGAVLLDMQGNRDLRLASIFDATGMTDHEFSIILLDDIYDVCRTHGACPGSEIRINAALAAMHDIRPKNALEGMLCAQMVSVHTMAMRVLSIANLKGQTSYSIEESVTHSTKLMRTFLMQVEALQKLRGKTTEQKVIVEHVNVQAGGQAIVGAVAQTGGEGKKGE